MPVSNRRNEEIEMTKAKSKELTTNEQVKNILTKYSSKNATIDAHVAIDIGFVCAAYMAVAKPAETAAVPVA